jgi:hypothetical protein
MLSRFRAELRRPSAAFVLSAIALFVALGGTGAFAVDKVTSKEIGNGEVQRVDLDRNAVVGKKVAKNSVKGSDIAYEPSITTNDGTIPPNGQNDILATCQEGEIISGGGWVLGEATSPTAAVEATSSPWPPTNGATAQSWLVALVNTTDDPVTATAVALCVPE